MKLASRLAVLAAIWAAAFPLAARAQSAGEGVFTARCKGCHEPAIDRAPSKATLAAYPAAQIVDALTNGVMKPMAAGLSDEDKAAADSTKPASPSLPPTNSACSTPARLNCPAAAPWTGARC